MKGFFIIFLLLFSFVSYSQDKVKIRVQLKKGSVLINKVPWAKYNYTAGKYFISNLANEEFVSINSQSYGSGRYDKTTGNEILNYYCEVHFFKTDIELFEVEPGVQMVLELFYTGLVLENDVFNLANALNFKNKYGEKISERIFRTK